MEKGGGGGGGGGVGGVNLSDFLEISSFSNGILKKFPRKLYSLIHRKIGILKKFQKIIFIDS